MRSVRVAVGALVEGLWLVVGRPSTLVIALVVTILAALPFGVALGARLQTALAHQPPIDLDAGEIDADWWLEFRAQAEGLEATFTPAIIGAAAPLDNLSALLDASPRPAVLLLPVLLYVVLWALLWGGAIHRFHQDGGGTLRTFLSAATRHAPAMLSISLVAGIVIVLLYLTVHQVLFGPVYSWIEATAATERSAFFGRAGLYIVFAALLAAVSVVADYTRVMVVGSKARLGEAATSALRFIGRHTAPVVSLYLVTGALFVTLFVAYGLADRRLGGWRAVLAGQAYIVARLAIRLTFAASEVRLVQRVRRDR